MSHIRMDLITLKAHSIKIQIMSSKEMQADGKMQFNLHFIFLYFFN